ncbi:MAG: cytochrome c biogenesis heme-transporting ATPase CcmA [Marinagarivorans sp.]|nr:cytochrome c biogenesis heme-transporting ATPase CcmA [Marinagarivorans sp.]
MLQLNQFTCLRDDLPLFKPLTLAIASGEIVQIAGANGAGKTTLLRTLCGLYDSFDGDILWREQPVSQVRFEFLSQLLYLGHQSGVKKSLTARENLTWFDGVKGHASSLPIEAVLAEVGLVGYADIPCHQMSAGQHRRVGLARLYLATSPLWVLDEPFTAIDKQGVVRLEQKIEAHAQAGGAVILTTHHPLSVARFRVVELDRLNGAGHD